MNTERALSIRRSVRRYLDTPVEDDKLRQILIAGNDAPSAMNNQKKTFIAVCSKAVKQKINEAVKSTCTPETIERICSRSTDGSFSFFYNAPVLIVVASSDKLYPEADCACAIENMYLRATDLGLSACWINQLTRTSNADVLKLLAKVGLSSDSTVYGCLAVGYSDVAFEPKAKSNKIVVVK
jgi:nitroreductase